MLSTRVAHSSESAEGLVLLKLDMKRIMTGFRRLHSAGHRALYVEMSKVAVQAG